MAEALFLTHDIRVSAVDYKRVHDHKAKWQNGVNPRFPHRPYNPRPQRHENRWDYVRVKKSKSSRNQIDDTNAHGVAKPSWDPSASTSTASIVDTVTALKSDRALTPTATARASSPSSATTEANNHGHSEDDEEALAEAEAGGTVFRSFDRATGPTEGADVLGHAVAAAATRFENVQTERLVRNEYDVVVDSDDESVARAERATKSNKKGRRRAKRYAKSGDGGMAIDALDLAGDADSEAADGLDGDFELL